MAGPQSIRRLADRYKEIVGRIGARADELNGRLDKVDERSGSVFEAHSKALDLIERGVAEIEDFTNQLSNGGPPLEGSTLPDADSNGVVLNKSTQ